MVPCILALWNRVHGNSIRVAFQVKLIAKANMENLLPYCVCHPHCGLEANWDNLLVEHLDAATR